MNIYCIFIISYTIGTDSENRKAMFVSFIW